MRRQRIERNIKFQFRITSSRSLLINPEASEFADFKRGYAARRVVKQLYGLVTGQSIYHQFALSALTGDVRRVAIIVRRVAGTIETALVPTWFFTYAGYIGYYRIHRPAARQFWCIIASWETKRSAEGLRINTLKYGVFFTRSWSLIFAIRLRNGIFYFKNWMGTKIVLIPSTQRVLFIDSNEVDENAQEQVITISITYSFQPWGLWSFASSRNLYRCDYLFHATGEFFCE